MALTNANSHVTNGELLSLLSQVVAKEATLRAAAVAPKADSATSLSGYGILDAYTKAEVDSAISSAISDADLDKYVEKKDGYDLISATDLAKIGANETAIGVLNGADTVAGSVAKSIKDAFDDFATKLSDDGVVNTFKEMVDYIAAHQGEYTTIAGEVQNNTTAIGVLNGNAETTGSVAKAVADSATSVLGTVDTKLTEYTKTADLPKESTAADMTEIFNALYPVA